MKTKKRTLVNFLHAFVVAIFVMSLMTTTPAYAAAPDLSISMTHAGTWAPLDTGRTYTITVTNVGDAPSSGLVTVVDTLPPGLSATAISGTGWNCTLATLTCTRSDALNGGESYSDITLTVNVLIGALPSITNSAQVSGGGDTDNSNNTAEDVTAIDAKADLTITSYQLLNVDKTAVITQPNPNETFWVRMTIQNQGGVGTGNFYPGVFLDDKPNYGTDHDSAGGTPPPGYPITLTLGEITDFQKYRVTGSSAQLQSGIGCVYYDPNNLVNPANTEVMSERGNYHPIQFLPGLAENSSATYDVEIAYPQVDYGDSIYDSRRTGLPAGSYKLYLFADTACNVTESIESIYAKNPSNPTETAAFGTNAYGPVTVNVGSPTCTPTLGGPQVFGDVPTTHWARDYIEAMYYCGYTGGCSSNPLLFCPDKVMSRVESAVFLLRSTYGTAYAPPPAPWTTFGDDFTQGPWGQPWAQGLYDAGLTAGCSISPRLFCPWAQTTRSQLAVFGMRMLNGATYFPSAGTGTVFADVGPSDWFAGWAEEAYANGIIQSCGTSGGRPLFCPNSLVTRAEASFTIAKAKNLVP